MQAKDTEFVVLDVETTGLSPLNGDRIIEIAAIKVKNKVILDTFEFLINPERLIPKEAVRVHNITQDMVDQAPTSVEILPQIIDFIGGSCLVGHNVKFDLDFLCYELALAGRKLRVATPAIDTLKMAREIIPHLTNYRLPYLASILGERVKITHRALADVKLTYGILVRLLDKAHEQKIETLRQILKKFSVTKPEFKIQQIAQTSLF